jgi:uncharacterized protein (TIGR02145 family)
MNKFTSSFSAFIFSIFLIGNSWILTSCSGDEPPDAGGSSSSGNIVYGASVTYGNEIYETVVIGTQTWFKRNLNYNPNDGNSWCYGDEEYSEDEDVLTDAEIQANCVKYGRLYDWATTMALSFECNSTSCANQIQPKHKGICPSGFHIPTNADWNELINYVGDSLTAGKKLTATEGWMSYEGENGNGTNDYGFSALPGGCRAESDPYGGCMRAGYGGHWWSVDEYDDNSIAAYYQGIGLGYVYQSYRGKGFGFSIRCLKN